MPLGDGRLNVPSLQGDTMLFHEGVKGYPRAPHLLGNLHLVLAGAPQLFDGVYG